MLVTVRQSHNYLFVSTHDGVTPSREARETWIASQRAPFAVAVVGCGGRHVDRANKPAPHDVRQCGRCPRALPLAVEWSFIAVPCSLRSPLLSTLRLRGGQVCVVFHEVATA
jgi:hypothetical protein